MKTLSTIIACFVSTVICHHACAAILEPTRNVGPRGGIWSIGIAFQVEEPTEINALGVWEDEDGLDEEHQVAVWIDDPESEPLGSVVVPAGDEAILLEGFRYALMPGVLLEPGQVYVMGAHTGITSLDPFNDAADPGPGMPAIGDDPDVDSGVGFLPADGVTIIENRFAGPVGFEELQFTGSNGGGPLGRWAGANAEFLEPLTTPGDFNDDGTVDLADFEILIANFNTSGRTTSEGDSNFDRRIDLSDFLDFRSVFNAANPPVGAATVPEPSSLFLMACGSVAILAGLLGRPR